MYTECTAEGWADQQVSDGGPCLAEQPGLQYKCTQTSAEDEINIHVNHPNRVCA